MMADGLSHILEGGTHGVTITVSTNCAWLQTAKVW
jgi:hypothetical protein